MPLSSGFPDGCRQLPGTGQNPSPEVPSSLPLQIPTIEIQQLGNLEGLTGAWTMVEGPRPRSTTALQSLLFKGKLFLFLRFTKVKTKTNFFLINFFAGTEAAKPVPGTLCPFARD